MKLHIWQNRVPLFLAVIMVLTSLVFREANYAFIIVCLSILSLLAIILYQTDQNSKLLALSIETLKRGSLGDYLILEKGVSAIRMLLMS